MSIPICKAIIKTGKNKGKQCQNKGKHNGLCGKHLNYIILENEDISDTSQKICFQSNSATSNIDNKTIIPFNQYAVGIESNSIVLPQKCIRMYLIYMKYKKYYNTVSMFTQENTNDILIYVIYKVGDKYIKEDFQGLYEWFIRSKGDKIQFKCIHTQLILSSIEKDNLMKSFNKILYNKQYFKTYSIQIKSIKTLYDKLCEECDLLDKESYNVIFNKIFRCMDFDMLMFYIKELSWNIKEYILSSYKLINDDYISKLKNKSYSIENLQNMKNIGDIKIKNSLNLNNLSIADFKNLKDEINLINIKLYITSQLKDFCTVDNELDDGKLDFIKDSNIWRFSIAKYIKDKYIYEESCIQDLLKHDSIVNYDISKLIS